MSPQKRVARLLGHFSGEQRFSVISKNVPLLLNRGHVVTAPCTTIIRGQLREDLSSPISSLFPRLFVPRFNMMYRGLVPQRLAD
jgi:hypothetical protein